MNNLIETEEKEIKLVATDAMQAKLLTDLRNKKEDEIDAVLSTIRAAFELAEFEISQAKIKVVLDEYYDTKDLFLYDSHASLRVRRQDGQVEITVKKPLAQEPGQFTRSENTKIISEEQYPQYIQNDFHEITKAVLPDIKNKSVELTVKINNERRSFLLTRGDEKYELVLDLISFTNPKTGKTSETLSEVEIEALNEAARKKLGGIKRNIVEIIKKFSYSTDSKYERAIKYFGFDKRKAQRRFLWWNNEIGLAQAGIVIAVLAIVVTVIIALLTGK